MIGLGYSLWRVSRQTADQTPRIPEARTEQAAV
jgi:hypothetical protein